MSPITFSAADAGTANVRHALWWAVLAAGVIAIAAFSPVPPYHTDSGTYERIGRDLVVPDCSSLHCTRVLVPWVLEQLPGPSRPKWKAYAVAGTLAAAAGVAQLVLLFGFSQRASRIAAWLAAFGGAQLTLFDPFTADPLMFALAPWTIVAIFRGQIGAAAALSAVGVLAKEFAAAPLWICVLFGVIARRRDLVIRCAAAASVATVVWLCLQLWFILRYNYSFAGSPSSQLLGGGYLTRWIGELGLTQAVGALVLRLGPLLALAAAGFRNASPPLRRLTVATIPAAVMFAYVQQPDRALWNFAFVLVPLATGLLVESSRGVAAAFVAGYTLSNVHLGPAVTTWIAVPAWAVATFAAISIATDRGRRRVGALGPRQARPLRDGGDLPPRAPIGRRALAAFALSSVALVTASLAVADVAAHRSVETGAGTNVWGYKGPVLGRRRPAETRVAILGGSVAFGTAVDGSLAKFLEDDVNVPRLQRLAGFEADGPITVVNLSTACDDPRSFQRTLDDYRYLGFDAVCFYVGHDDNCGTNDGWRRTSPIFRRTGYLPMLPGIGPASPVEAPPLSDEVYLSALEQGARHALANRMAVVIATHPFLTAADARRQDLVADRMAARLGKDVGFVYVDLRAAVAPAAEFQEDAVRPSPRGNSFIAERLADAVFRALKQQK